MRIRDLLESLQQKYTDKPAIIFKDTPVSFSELNQKTRQLSRALQSLGVKKGVKVGIYLPNCPQYVYSYLSTFMLGAVGVPLDYMLKQEELLSCLSHSETKILIAMPKKDVDFSALKEQIPSLEKVIIYGEILEGFLHLSSIMEQASRDPIECDVGDSDPALIMYTSGTTGKPKGILLNYKHLEGSPQAMKHFVDLTDKDTKLCPLPLSHIGGFIYIQNCIYFGITLVLMGRFNPFTFLENVQKYHVTCFHIVPPMYNAILTLKQIDRFDLSSLRWMVVFGAPSSPEILKRFHRHCPNAQLLNGWGMTETCPPNTVTPLGSDNIASVGKPAMNCDIKILDDTGQELPVGEIGEIVISGWIVMDSYYRDPEATAAMKGENGLHTGDLGRFDENGFLYIVGRKKEMIKVGGQIVYAPEVEAAFYKHEGVTEVAVIGIPDAMKGEAVKAFVVLKDGKNTSSDDLRFFIREQLANFKVPSQIEIKTDLPKNRTGKIDKIILKESM
ncbi:MAG: AMP-binding protein [Candidatus Omnitrophica bacterium]|nr:AMP-binding protein [Candidatus Omnitrophota bacterium]